MKKTQTCNNLFNFCYSCCKVSYEMEDYSLEHPETRILFLGLRVSTKTFTCLEECVAYLGFAEEEEMMFFCSRSTGS